MRHQDMKVLGIDVTEKADAASVTKILYRIAETTGLPAQILSAGGSSIRRGVSDFIKEVKKADSNSEIRQTYDVTHKAALVIEHHLENDEIWKMFINSVSETKRCLIHTAIGFIAPPKPKDKARWANLDIYVEWAETVTRWGKTKLQKAERDKFNDKLA